MKNDFYTYPKFYHQFHDFPKNERDFYSLLAKDKKNILELGCGTGRIFNSISKNSFYFGLDNSYKMLSFFKNNYNKSNLIYGNWLNLPFIKDFFDLILMPLNALNHIDRDEIEIFLEGIYKVLSNEGIFIIEFLTDKIYKNIKTHYLGSFELKGEKIEIFEKIKILENKKISVVWSYFIKNKLIAEESSELQLWKEEEILNLLKKNNLKILNKRTKFKRGFFSRNYGKLILKIKK